MSGDPLSIVSTGSNEIKSQPPRSNGIKERKNVLQAKMERLWMVDPKHFDPQKNVKERLRLERTLSLITEFLNLQEKAVADIGCGSGVFTRMLRDHGAKVHAVDIASNALHILEQGDMQDIESIQDGMPSTKLQDDFYDLVICTELIALLDPRDHRLFFSELARIVKPDGFVICSTKVDFTTEDPVQQFGDLAETEFQIEKWKCSYHRVYIKLKGFFEAPSNFHRASLDNAFRARYLAGTTKLTGWWYRLNTGKALGWLWSILKQPFRPIVYLLSENRSLLLRLEKICHFFWTQEGISHAIFIGKRRPMVQQPPEDQLPQEPKHKKMVWE